MIYKFSIKDILENKLNSMKYNMYGDLLYEKVQLTYQVWLKQKELKYAYIMLDSLILNTTYKEEPFLSEEELKSLNYKEQYISFLIKHDLFFLEEVKEDKVILNLLYYWLLREIKIDKNQLNTI